MSYITQKKKIIDNITNIDCKKEFQRLLKQGTITFSGEFISLNRDKVKSSSNSWNTLYGQFFNGKITPFEKPKFDIRVYNKNGIEVLGMKPSEKTADGKFKYQGISIKDLKKHCKENGLKRFSSLDKVGLVKILMTI